MKTKLMEKDQLLGIWAALPVPWKEDGTLDAEMFSRDLARCCQAGVHGIYSGGTTGEFYAQDIELYCRINRIQVEIAHAHGVPVQAGCTALCTEEVCKRVRYAARIGADIVQIALPFWLRLDDDEVLDFFEAVAEAAQGTPIVHYDTIRAKRRIEPDLYARLCQRVPTLWGTKFGGTDIYAVKQITMANPDLKVFVGEHILASAMPMGATGSYSSAVLLNPDWMLDYYRACRDNDWNKAFSIQDEVSRLFSTINFMPTSGLQDTAFDRIFCQLGGWLECPLIGKAPYRHASREDLVHLRSWMEQHLPRLLRSSRNDLIPPPPKISESQAAVGHVV